MRIFLIIILAFVFGACTSAPKQDVSDRPIVVLVGIDGLRHDFIDKYEAPTLHELAATGVRAESMRPVMPSLTFPNFYSIATGLYAEKTGITSNMPISKSMNAVMERKAHGESRWWGGEPIWVTAEKQGVRAATMFWVGSEARIKGKRPSYWLPYDHGKPNTERIEQVLEWLSLPERKRPNLITVYFSVVDSAAHRYGVDAPEVGNAIIDVDARIQELKTGIRELGLHNHVNLILVSDHGMSEVPPKNLIYLDDYIDFGTVHLSDLESEIGSSMVPITYINVENGDVEGIYHRLEGAHPNMRVFRYADLPANWHLSNADRTGDIIAVADPGWLMFGRKLKSRYKTPAKGMHGYDRFHPEMQAIFIAQGPAFKSGVRVSAFDNVEIYGLIAEILQIVPAKTDGNPANIAGILAP